MGNERNEDCEADESNPGPVQTDGPGTFVVLAIHRGGDSVDHVVNRSEGSRPVLREVGCDRQTL